jgi:PhoH-like ATPase
MGGRLEIELNHNDPACLPNGLEFNKNDTKILAITKNIADANKDIPTILVTKDLYMAIKSDAMGIITQDYENDKITTEELYQGNREVIMSRSDIDRIRRGGMPLPLEWDFKVHPNEFFVIKTSKEDQEEFIARFDGKELIPLKYAQESAWGLTPINKEQLMAFELLMDPEIDFISLSGGAGSGKTIVSTAVALQKVIELGVYRRVIFVKPVVAAGEDIGYLPGTEEEKLRPWMGSFYDAVESLMDLKDSKKDRMKSKKSKKDEFDGRKAEFSVDEFIEQFRRSGAIETKTFTYMRGRTLSDAIVIVDEAQQTTPHLAKLMLTRAGFDSKFVFIGDPTDNQIDNTLVDEKSNGLVYTIEKMKDFKITGHVTLRQVERSPLAKLAEKYM